MSRFNLLLVVLVVFFVALPASAQVKLGLIGGLNVANLSGEDLTTGEKIDLSSRTAFAVGGVLDIGLSENLALAFEPMYLQAGAKQTVEGLSGETTYKVAYLEVPVLLKVSIGTKNTRPYLIAGPFLGLKLSSKAESSIPGFKGEVDIDALIVSTNFGLALGAGISFKLETVSLFIEGQYALGLSDIVKAGVDGVSSQFATSKITTRGTQVMAGITFPIGSK